MRTADKTGPTYHANQQAWRAWKIPISADHPAALACWVVHCPGLHAAWQYWQLGLCHLRTVEGMAAAHYQYPDAEHEIQSLVIDPTTEPDVERGLNRFLTPCDVVEQFHGVSDAQAIAMLERFVDLIVRRMFSPDSDFRSSWHQSIWATVEHITTGHPQGQA